MAVISVQGALMPQFISPVVIEVVDLNIEVQVPEGPELPEKDDELIIENTEMASVPRKRGRPKKVVADEQIQEVMRLYFVEKLSMRKVADVMGVSHMSVYRMLSDPDIELLL